MKDFNYRKEKYDLYPGACLWLRHMGLIETRWFLDSAWLLSSYNDLSYKKWVKIGRE